MAVKVSKTTKLETQTVTKEVPTGEFTIVLDQAEAEEVLRALGVRSGRLTYDIYSPLFDAVAEVTGEDVQELSQRLEVF